MAIVLQGVNPTTFNLVASILAEVLQLVAAFTLSAFLHLMVSIFARNGNKIPVDALGPLPAGLIDAFHYARAMKWAWPATVAVFLFASDYSTTIAFAGLSFEYIEQEGPQEPVLNLANRNDYFPYEAIGDPLLPYTTSKLEEMSGSKAASRKEDEILLLAKDNIMVASFMGAVDGIAQGRSVYLEASPEFSNNPSLLVVGHPKEGSLFSGFEESTVLYGTSESSFLAGVSLEIPLHCSDTVMAAVGTEPQLGNLMTTIEEHHGPDDWKVKSHVPNCTFTSTRGSGIYGVAKTSMKNPMITSFASVGSGANAKLMFHERYLEYHSTFVFPYEGLYLARETRDFREGRRVFGFGGVKIGDSYIPFEATVVSSG